ncbi:hypothetical protein [Micromonospora aurantiaca (nom. illeg.)]|uniref:hypothetical protein n=1 Tax=Micromonospora aurantiaca (nom. illeg.) TaxID=47850 RepID=UPI000827667B|nr:hypothetical protein [Micromonospora aurantiaca]SCL21162.1 hypothetical protein GA0070615_0009 [Micromonospora aurantiaca]
MTETTMTPAHLQGLTDDQVALYRRMLEQVAASGADYWTTLRELDAPAADKYHLAAALGSWPAQVEHGTAAGIDPHRGQVDMHTLSRGDLFVGPDGTTRYEVVTPASEHPRGWVDVRNLSMTDDEAAALVERPGAVERVRDAETGEMVPGDPREGFFAYSHPTYVDRVSPELAPVAVTEVDADEL